MFNYSRILWIKSCTNRQKGEKQHAGVHFVIYSIAYWMPIQQKLTPPELLYSFYAGRVRYDYSFEILLCAVISESETTNDWNWNIIRNSQLGRRGVRWLKVVFNFETFLSSEGLTMVFDFSEWELFFNLSVILFGFSCQFIDVSETKNALQSIN